MTTPGSEQAEQPDEELPAGSPTTAARTGNTEATTIPTTSTAAASAPDLTVGPVSTDPVSTDPGSRDPQPHPDVEHVGLIQQAIRYFGTGVMSAVVDFGLLLILMAVGVGYTPAKAASFIAGTITAYSLNRRFTFKAQPSLRRFLLTMLTYVVTFVLQVGIFAKLFPLLADEHLPRLVVQTISFVFGQGAATVANFSMQRWLIFRPTRVAEAAVQETGAAVTE